MLRSLCARFAGAALLAGTMAVTAAPPAQAAAVAPAPAQAGTIAVQQCTATLTVVAQWPGGFAANVTVTNTGTEPITGWMVVIVFPTNVVTIVSRPWNGALAPGASTTSGFTATGNYTPPSSISCMPT